MPELSEDEYTLLTDIAMEFESAVNLLEAWSEKNYVLEVDIILDRIKPKIEALRKLTKTGY